MDRVYIAIDLKSFYASVECVIRGMDPLQTNLVVADASRTEKTICLAVSPALKAYGIPGRARLFEVVEKVRQINEERKKRIPDKTAVGTSCFAPELEKNPGLLLDYIVAPPQMALYKKRSTDVLHVYLQYIAPEDIHVYSVDEVFIDVTGYLKIYEMSARELTEKLIHQVLEETGITATAGIGTNMYLAKIAMDVMAKKVPADEHGVRIAELNERSYRELLWDHTPITDFWRVGAGYARKLAQNGLYTMGDIARCSLGKENEFYNEDLLYKMFGVNAELLIDHAWGYEPCTIKEIKNYRSENMSLGSGQVLQSPYTAAKAKLITKEMTDLLILSLVDKGLVTDQMVLTIGYDKESLTDPEVRRKYHGPIVMDHYGRPIPKHAHGSVTLSGHMSSTKVILGEVMNLYDRIVNPDLLIRRVNITANHVIREEVAEELKKNDRFEQLDLFTDYAEIEKQRREEKKEREREKRMQKAVLDIQKKFGKNAILKGMNLEEGAMTIERNGQIGGHKA